METGLTLVYEETSVSVIEYEGIGGTWITHEIYVVYGYVRGGGVFGVVL